MADLNVVIVKLKGNIVARRQLKEKLKKDPNNEKISNRIKELTNQIKFLKDEIDFNEIFEALEISDGSEEKDNEIISLRDAIHNLEEMLDAKEKVITLLKEEIANSKVTTDEIPEPVVAPKKKRTSKKRKK